MTRDSQLQGSPSAGGLPHARTRVLTSEQLARWAPDQSVGRRCGGRGVMKLHSLGSGTWPLGRPFSSTNRVFSTSMLVPGSVHQATSLRLYLSAISM